MKKNLLLVAALAVAVSAGAQTTYNFFDAEDVDKDGWLWFDSAAKIKKYCGTSKNSKVRLLEASWETEDFEYPASTVSATAVGFNEAGVKGGPGAKTGAIILPETNFDQCMRIECNGGSIMMYLPDCAKVDMFLSVGAKEMFAFLKGGNGHLREADLHYIDTHFVVPDFPSISSVLANAGQFEWADMQDIEGVYASGDQTDLKIKLHGKPGEAKTLWVGNNNTTPLYIHGMRILTYTNTSAGIGDVISDLLRLSIAGKRVETAVEADIEVYSIAGVKVASERGTSLDCGMLASGVYVVKATADGVSATAKAVF